MTKNQIQIIQSSGQLFKDPEETSEDQIQHSSPITFFGLFRFADRLDYILMTVGTIFAMANGACMPIFAWLCGDMLNSFGTGSNMVQQSLDMFILFVEIGIGVFGSGWIMIACWLITGERQSIRCRKEYLKSLLRQEIGWFDLVNQSELTSQFSTDTVAFQGAISDKIPMVMYVIAMGIAGLIIAFVKGWLLTLVLFGVFPLLIGSMYLYMRHIQMKGQKQQKSYDVAGGRAEQALFSIKTVKMMNGESYQSEKYDECLRGASKGAVKQGIFTGISIGGAMFSMLSAYALGFWFGAHCINGTDRCGEWNAKQEYDAGIVFTVSFCIILVGFNVSQLPSSLKKITQGRVAAGRIFKIVDRKPKITNPVDCVRIENFKGIIKFHNVHFTYPKDKKRKILNGINLEINKSKIAFVGESGCGKSTLLQLIMRFYDPDAGYITIDGHDIRTLDLKWLREVIGYVGQQPVLFNMTIRENLLFAKQTATEKQIEEALRKAEALDFVKKLQKGLDTNVGLGGGQISGGQKQRIAIARAILRDPKILLLDEATSALDRKNQKLIQRTLNKISQARTSITIAHRVKTIMGSDQIFVVEKGLVKEQGKFNQLQRFEGMEMEQNNQQDPKQINLAQNVFEEKSIKIQTKQEIAAKQNLEKVSSYSKSTYGRVFSYAKDRWFLFTIGILSSVVVGCIYPVFTIFFSSLLKYMLTQKDFISEAETRALIFFLLGVLGLVLSIVQNICFEVIGGQITAKIRSEVFYKMMKLPIYWFERPQNNIGQLTTRLAVDSKQVKDLTTNYVYVIIQNIATLMSGLIIGFIFEWRTALVSLGLIPFLIAAGAVRMAFKNGALAKAEQTYRQSSNLIMESMTNIRTVCSFGYEDIIYNKYEQKLMIPQKVMTKSGIVSGFFYGLSQFIMFFILALIFYLGALFVQNNGASLDDMFTAVFAIFFAALTIGNHSHMLPDVGECSMSAAHLFVLLDEKDENQIQIDENSKLLKTKINGNFVFKDIKFKYESRNDYLFHNFNLQIPFGEKIAFVGTSGCGKSTIMSFLLRFYEPEQGQILLDGVNIKDYDIHHLRSQFGVVSQQPILFNDSYKENIIYNMKASDEQMIDSAKKANAYGFIMNSTAQSQGSSLKNQQNPKIKIIQSVDHQKLKSGFDRGVGLKGGHISGGQKQRVAIARAILRKPEILLLDEATSALDSANQKIVQNCLDEIMVGKSSISIAHRLDTIKNSKTIYLFDKGRVAECGNYEQLMNKKGYFYNLEKGIEFQ